MTSSHGTIHPSESSAPAPPHSPEAEAAVLSALLMDNSTWDSISRLLGENDFYSHQNRRIYSAIACLMAFKAPADAITVHDFLQRRGKAEDMEGSGTLKLLAQERPDAGSLQNYIDIVRDCSIRRKLLDAGEAIVRTARNPHGKTVNKILDEAAHAIFNIGEEDVRVKPGFESMDSLVSDVLRRAQDRAGSPLDITGIPTGFDELDCMTSGLQAGDLLILAARPSMGSTALSLNIAEHAALEEGLHVAIFSMGAAPSQLANRLVGSVSRIEQDRLRNGQLSDDEWSRLAMAAERLRNAPLHIDGTPGLSSREVCANARRLARQFGKLGLIVVDHLQLMGGASLGESNSVDESRIAEMGDITRDLKMLASELQCPVIALAQLNLSVETRSDKRPVLGDLRELGDIEHHADGVMFVYRDDFYNPESCDPGTAEIIIAKQRNGPIGMVRLAFHKSLARFERLDGLLVP